MGKSIRKPRGRPRVRSVNFRTLWWLLRVEATWRICYRYVLPETVPRTRNLWRLGPMDTRTRMAYRLLAKQPERRFYP